MMTRRVVLRLDTEEQQFEVEDVLIVETFRDLVVVEFGDYLQPISPTQVIRPHRPELN